MRKHYCVFVVLSIIMMLTACTGSHDNNLSDQYDDIMRIAIYTKNQYDSHTLQLEKKITRDNLDSFEKDENVSEILSDDEYYYMSAMMDEDTVIIHQNSIFQSATGYVATTKESLDTLDEDGYRDPLLNVPACLGYDNDRITIEKYLGAFEDWHLYRYSAGL